MKVKKDFSRSMCHHHLTVSKPNSKCSSTLFPLTPKCHCSLLTTTQICPCLSIRSNTVLFTSSFVHSLTLQISTEHLLHASTVLETSYNHEQKQRRRSQLSGCFIVIVGEGRGNTVRRRVGLQKEKTSSRKSCLFIPPALGAHLLSGP